MSSSTLHPVNDARDFYHYLTHHAGLSEQAQWDVTVAFVKFERDQRNAQLKGEAV